MIGALKLLKPKRIPIVFVGHFKCSSKPPLDPKEEWKDLEQRAIIAFHFMDAISGLRLLDASTTAYHKFFVAQKIRAKAQELGNKKMISQSWQNSLDKNIDIVWEGMNPRIGATVNLDIYKQSRFKLVADNGRIVLLPSFITGQIFHKLLNFYADPTKKQNQFVQCSFIISGQIATGKSFAYLIYDYLSQFIIAFRMSNAYRASENLLKFVPIKQFLYVKKLVYIPLRQVDQLDNLVNHLCLYQHQQLTENFSTKDIIQRLQQILMKIAKIYHKKGISLLYIIDEANYYYSCFRAKKLKEQDQIVSIKANENILCNISAGLGYIRRYTNILVFNSSQSVQNSLITEWNMTNDKKYFDINQHKSTSVENLHINYSEYLETEYGQTIIYQFFWQNLSFQLKLENKQLFKNVASELYRIFRATFGLEDTQKPSKRQLLYWKIDVKYLNIRVTLQKKQKIKGLVQLLKNINALSECREKIQNQLLSLKKSIEDQYYQSTKLKFTSYFKKNIISYNDQARFRIICWINQTAYQLMQNLQKYGQNYSKSSQHLIPTSNSIKTGLNSKQIASNNQKKQKDFGKLMSKTDIKKEQKLHSDLPEILKLQIRKQLNKLVEMVGIGYQDRNQPNKFYYFMEPKMLWSMTLLINSNFTSYSSAILSLLIYQVCISRFVGNNMDLLYYQLFKQRQNFKIKMYNYSENKQQYQIKSTLPFEYRSIKSSEKPMNLRLQLKNLVKFACQPFNNKEYILGYPEDVSDQATQKFAPNNPFFDFVIVQKITLGNLQRFKIHTFDYTVGTIENKLKDFIKGPKAKDIGGAQQLYALVSQIKNMQQLKGIQPDNIQFKHIFLAPDYQIKSFQQEVKKQIRSNAYGNKKRSLILFEGMYMNPKNNIGMIVGAKAAKYLVRGDHIQLSQQDRNQEDLFFVSFKSVIETISAKNSLKR